MFFLPTFLCFPVLNRKGVLMARFLCVLAFLVAAQARADPLPAEWATLPPNVSLGVWLLPDVNQTASLPPAPPKAASAGPTSPCQPTPAATPASKAKHHRRHLRCRRC
jgi:hypothetical protein